MDKNPLFDKYGTSVPSGTAIFREGEAGDRMYIIQSGVVRITKNIEGVEHTLADLQKGDFFGERDVVDEEEYLDAREYRSIGDRHALQRLDPPAAADADIAIDAHVE